MSSLPPAQVSNTIIRASAGSGKTYALVQRLLRLLALDVQPQSIVALTFTRKAAGEFFARLLQRLADFAEHPEQAESYLPELARDGDARKTSLKLLRLLLAQMDRMRMGTLDSYFAAMVQSLPFELGLTGVGKLMSGAEERQAVDEVLEAVLIELTDPANEPARRELVEAWKMATLGSESNTPMAIISQWMENLHDRFLECPDPEKWGAAGLIWKAKEAAIWQTDGEATAIREALESHLDISQFKAKIAAQKWEEFFQAIEDHAPGVPLPGGITYMLEEGRGDIALLERGEGSWKIGNSTSVSLNREASARLLKALQWLVGREMRAVCLRTKGQSKLVAVYEKLYQRMVRGRGRLCFGDLALLLSGRLDPSGNRDRQAWDQRWEEIREQMEYRLNARYDHWLFDEFQDTSRRQWRVFENLVDEVLQDAESRRTFFAVGDLKQSIYLWREAEPELFLNVEKRYEHHRMEKGSLKVSWRSCPAVLRMVNDTFGNQDQLKEVLPAGAMDWWQFEEHESAEKVQDMGGHATLLSVQQKEEKDELVATLIRQIRPLERGLSCAVLVRKNERARELSAYLRATLGCEVVCESEQAVTTDNPVTLAMLSLLQLGAHPTDEYAWQHLRMTPLKKWLDVENKSAANVAYMIRRDLRLGGFLAVAERWVEIIRQCVGDLDAFSEWRLRQFMEVSAEFDESGSRDVDSFLRFARDYRVAGPGGSSALQVMTVHKSKGLEFDVVIMPELQATGMEEARRHSLLWKRSDDDEIDWMLEKPAAKLLNWDRHLLPELKNLEARSAFEGLCRLYVAMTRAKRGLYLVHHRSGVTQKRSEAGLLNGILQRGDGSLLEYPLPGGPEVGSFYEAGNRDWYQRIPVVTDQVGAPLPQASSAPPLKDLLQQVNEIYVRRTPSGEESHRISGKELLSPRRETARLKGLLVHGLFAELTWMGEATLESVRASLDQSSWADMEGYQGAVSLVLQSLANPDIHPWFRQTPGVIREAWRERSFDVMVNGEWVSGQIDRVVIEKDLSGQVLRAVILDFKTDEVSGDEALKQRAQGYAPQLRLYAKAVAKLTGIPEQKVGMALIFVAADQMIWLNRV